MIFVQCSAFWISWFFPVPWNFPILMMRWHFRLNQHQTKVSIQQHIMSTICNIIKKAKSLPSLRFLTRKRNTSSPVIEPVTSPLSPTPIISQPVINISSPKSSAQSPPPLIIVTATSIPMIQITPPNLIISYPFISLNKDFSDLFWHPDNQLEIN